MKPLAAGRLRHRVDIEQPTDTPNDYGDPAQTWTTYATRRAEIKPISGREGWRYAQVQSTVTHEITVRYVAGITTKMRVKFGDRYFGIDSAIDTEERHVETVLICKEGV